MKLHARTPTRAYRTTAQLSDFLPPDPVFRDPASPASQRGQPRASVVEHGDAVPAATMPDAADTGTPP